MARNERELKFHLYEYKKVADKKYQCNLWKFNFIILQISNFKKF